MSDILDLDCRTYILIICNASSYLQVHIYVQVSQTTLEHFEKCLEGNRKNCFDLLH